PAVLAASWAPWRRAAAEVWPALAGGPYVTDLTGAKRGPMGSLGVLTMKGEALMTRDPRPPVARQPGVAYRGGVAEWLKAADCKSAGGCLRRFESYPLHQRGTYSSLV